MAPFQLGCVGVGSKNAFSNRSLFALMGTPKVELKGVGPQDLAKMKNIRTAFLSQILFI